ncbi:cytochrome-c peroxidase [Hymenobacter sp. BT491]|uniref:cytochrome-c peroxidase n=1 Tax=Hymenobacter sp. BT491 TaxID=2766779 RepID=UPI0016536BF5|nr:cytochrome c peroxidase [Hymenobacter sp. BT491]MBC6988618.1 cytochrome-c peroxidase [Hymenobacter sp. BT491]
MIVTARLLRWGLLAPWGVALALNACTSNGTEEPAPDPGTAATPYSLVLPAKFPPAAIPADNALTEEGVALGRMLFYEPRLSRDNTMSCGSCHQQSKAFTDGRAHALGVDGTPHPRGAMSLTNVLWEPQLNWDGAATSLETQARIPIENPVELHQSLADGVRKLQATTLYPPLFKKAFGTQEISEQNVLKALAQFERTLISADSRFDRYNNGERTALSREEVQGLVLFTTHPDPNQNLRGANCFHCHGAPLFTARDFFNNGLDLSFADQGRGAVTGQSFDKGKFRAPSLRNIALTAPYMHDGRFQTLAEVLDHYSEHVERASPNIDPNMLDGTNVPFGTQLNLTVTEKAQVVAFLRALTDSTFIQDKRFSDPFKP